MKESENLEIMLNVPDPARIFLITGYTDLRKGIDGVCSYIDALFRLTPYDGSAFIICGRRADRCKMLVKDKGGLVLVTKLLDEGRFKWPRKGCEAWRISLRQLEDLLAGKAIDRDGVIECLTTEI